MIRGQIARTGIIWLLLLGLTVQPSLALMRVGGGLRVGEPLRPFGRLSLDLVWLGFDLDYLPHLDQISWLLPCLKLRLPLLLVSPYVGLAPIVRLEPQGPVVWGSMVMFKAGSELALPSGSLFAELQLWANWPQLQIEQPGLALGILVGF